MLTKLVWKYYRYFDEFTCRELLRTRRLLFLTRETACRIMRPTVASDVGGLITPLATRN